MKPIKSSRSGLVIPVNHNSGPETIVEEADSAPEIGNIKPIRTALLHCRFWLEGYTNRTEHTQKG